MIAEQRQAFILKEIEENASVSIAELETLINVTRETLRRDIAALDRRNLLRQVRGGAIALENTESSVEIRSMVNPRGKEKIGRLAAELIPDKATIIIDSGSTTNSAVRPLMHKVGLRVITNDIAIATQLLKTAREVHLVGGQVRSDEHSTQGHDAIDMIERYPVDFALIGVGGLSAEHGVTDFSRAAARLRDAMIKVAKTSILLADHTKFGKIASVRLVNAHRARYLVSDGRPDDSILSMLSEAGTALVT